MVPGPACVSHDGPMTHQIVWVNGSVLNKHDKPGIKNYIINSVGLEK
jgi:hypothetical protein